MGKKSDNFRVKYFTDDEIVLEEDRERSRFMFFFFKYGRMITMIFVSVAILSLITIIALTFSFIGKITPPVIAEPGVIMQFNGGSNVVNAPSTAITVPYAEALFEKLIKGTPIKDKYKNVIDVIRVGNDKILVFEDGSAVIIYGDKSKLPIYVSNKNNIDVENNSININGDYVKVDNKNVLPDGTITYEFFNEYILIEKDDNYRLIKKDDILYDKTGNIKEDDVIDSINIIDKEVVSKDIILYFDNGSACIIYSDKNKLPVYIPNKGNLSVNNNKITIKGDVINTIRKSELLDGTIVYEFKNDKMLVATKDEYKLINKDKGTLITKFNEDDDTVLFFDNSSAVLIYDDDDKLPIYIDNWNRVSFKDDSVKVNGKSNKTVEKKELENGVIIYYFDNNKALVKNKDNYLLIDKDKIKIDSNGNLIASPLEINMQDFTVTNNTDKDNLKYRVVLEETSSYKTYNNNRLLPKYIYYKVNVNGKSLESKLMNSNIWDVGSIIEGNLKIENNTFILYEGEIDKLSSDKFNLGLWVDYESIGNDMQDKWFIGTLKVYGWNEE